MRIGIYTNTLTGHNLEYLQHMLDAFKPDNISLVLYVSGKERQKLKQIEASYNFAVAYHNGPWVKLSPFKKSYNECRAIINCFKQIPVDCILAPSGTYAPYFWRLLGKQINIPAYFLMTSTGLTSPINSLKDRLIYYTKHTLLNLNKPGSLATIDNCGHSVLKTKHPGLFKKFTLIPDPIEINHNFSKPNNKFCFEEKCFIVSLHGSFDSHPRKNAIALIEAVVDIDDDTVKLVLAGRMDTEIIDFIDQLTEKQRSRLWIHNTYLSEQDMIDITLASDLICVPYKDHFSPSGIVLRAMHLNKPVLVPDYHWFRFMVKHFDVGYLLPGTGKADIAKGILNAREKLQSKPFSGASDNAKRYFSVRNFIAHWQLIALGKSTDDFYSFDDCLKDEKSE